MVGEHFRISEPQDQRKGKEGWAKAPYKTLKDLFLQLEDSAINEQEWIQQVGNTEAPQADPA